MALLDFLLAVGFVSILGTEWRFDLILVFMPSFLVTALGYAVFLNTIKRNTAVSIHRSLGNLRMEPKEAIAIAIATVLVSLLFSSALFSVVVFLFPSFLFLPVSNALTFFSPSSFSPSTPMDGKIDSGWP